MRVLIACEYSGTVRDAFLAAGHDAWSNDIIDTDAKPDRHLKMDVLEAISRGPWDLIIVHIPCTAMGVCGNSTYGTGKPKHHERVEALEWSLTVWRAATDVCQKVVMENPASVLFPALRKAFGVHVQYVQPWMFGHMEQKKTGLAMTWAVPELRVNQELQDQTYIAMMKLPKKVRERIHYMSPGPNRGKERARFFTGISNAMADQWG